MTNGKINRHTMTRKFAILLLVFQTLYCTSQTGNKDLTSLTISPIIDQQNTKNAELILALSAFLETKNKSLTQNDFWLESDFTTYVYPYLDLYNIEQSKHGKDFFKPSLMEIIPSENRKQHVLKFAFIGHNQQSNENTIKSIYNIVATTIDGKIKFSKYLNYATKNWTKFDSGTIKYVVSPNKKVNQSEVNQQKVEVNQLINFFETDPIIITYFSCVNPKELFEIKGFDYNPMMYADTSGGFADHGNIIFSGNNAELYSHEIIHVYTNKLYPNGHKFLDEGIATYLAGSGKFDYTWHRNKLAKFIAENADHDFKSHVDPYERLYFETQTSIPYLSAALICERTNRLFGKQKLLQILKSGDELWKTLKSVGLTEDNINAELGRELQMPVNLISM